MNRSELFVEFVLDLIVCICAFQAFSFSVALLIFSAYWGIGACIDRNFNKLKSEK